MMKQEVPGRGRWRGAGRGQPARQWDESGARKGLSCVTDEWRTRDVSSWGGGQC